MTKRIISIVLVGLLLIVISLGGCAKAEESLKMVLIPGSTPLEAKRMWQPIADYLAQEIGVPIELVVATDYSTAIVALKTGDADIARLGPFSYVLAVTEAEVEPIAREVSAKTGLDSYTSLIIARADSGFANLEDLEGATFAFVDVASATGYLVPMAVFGDAGIDPESYFNAIQFAGSHNVVIEAVRVGSVDAGATNNRRWELALEEGAIDEGELVIIAESGPVPNSLAVVRKGFDEELKEKLQDAYLNIPEELSVGAFGVSGYDVAVDSDYDYIRLVAEVLDLDLGEMD